MRVRRLRMLGLVFVAGASLLRSSMALTGPFAAADPTVSLSLSSLDAPKPSNIWVVTLPERTAGYGADQAAASPPPIQLPDGNFALTITVKIGRRASTRVLTNAVTAPDLLEAMGVRLHKLDRVRPSRQAILWSGMRLQVIRFRRVVETVTESDPFTTLMQYSSDLPLGQSEILQAGVPGQAVRTYRVTYRNGREVARVLLSEDILSDPVDEVVLQGTGGAVHGSQVGQASWYDFCRIEGDYAAHLTLPFGTVVTVTNLDNGKTVTVVINDRGPYGVEGRIIDLCDGAFAQIAPLSQGVADVQITW